MNLSLYCSKISLIVSNQDKITPSIIIEFFHLATKTRSVKPVPCVLCNAFFTYYFTPGREILLCQAWARELARVLSGPNIVRPARLVPADPARPSSKYVVDSVLSPPSCFLSAEVLVGNTQNCRWF